MITQYYRPQTLDEALQLLSRPDTRPLGGGTVLARRSNDTFSVVDLQALGLDKLRKIDNQLEIGATVTLQKLLDSPYIPEPFKTAIKLEAPLNLRNMETVAGVLVTCDGRSSFGTIMLGLDATCTLFNGQPYEISLGNLLPLREEKLPGKIITGIKIPLDIKLAFETVARSPADKPIICTALAQWPSGRTRLAIGGWGLAPNLAMDGNESSGLLEASHNACAEANDEWASAEYRMEIARILAKRCQDAIYSS
jgi:putative selenate reductase FAD-binding subunit